MPSYLNPPEEERRGHVRDRGDGRALHLAAGAAEPVRPPSQGAVLAPRPIWEGGNNKPVSATRTQSTTNPRRRIRFRSPTNSPHSPANERITRPTSQPADQARASQPTPADLLSTPAAVHDGGGGWARTPTTKRGAEAAPDLDGGARRAAEGGMASATRSGRRWGEGKRRARGGVRTGKSEPEGTGRREDGESKSDDEFDV